MNRRKSAATLAGTLAVAMAATVLATAPATADVTSQYFGWPHTGQTSNASDPNIFRCEDPGPGTAIGYCLVTSQDLGQPPIDPDGAGKNYYPMEQTIGSFSLDGLHWGMPQIAITEAKMGKSGFKHLWAPTALWRRTPANQYFLYTPDLTNKNDRLSSRIFVSYSSSPTAGYATTNIPGTGSKVVELGNAPAGYMSDPDIFVDASDPSLSTAPTYLLWANGDNDTCGDFSVAKLSNPTTIQSGTAQHVTVNNLVNGPPGKSDMALGNCGGTGHPYVEGGSIYKNSYFTSNAINNLPGPYILLFAAKPQSTPGACAVPGQPNTANSVIAYATSSSPMGPYNYQGIIMCGSSTEWTNQATIEEVKGPDGKPRLVLVYHDGIAASGSTEPRNRQLHSEVLFKDGEGNFMVTARSAEGAVSSNGTSQWALTAPLPMMGFKSFLTGKFVTSPTDAQMKATANRIGAWEQFGVANSGGFNGLLARNPNKWVQVSRNAAGTPVIARGTAFGDWERWTLVVAAARSNEVFMKDAANNYWKTNPDGTIVGTSTPPNGWQSNYVFLKMFLWS